jgi:DNA-binding protein WhiA
MSFASETKNELSRVMPEKRCCMLAEIAGFIRVAGSVSLAGGGKFRIILTTDNPAVARHYKKMLKEYFKIETETSIGQGSGISRGKKYKIHIGPGQLSEQILRETGILMVREGMNYITAGVYDGIIKTKCCRKAYLRGAFLGAGTMTNPEKSYQYEIVCTSQETANDIRKLINSFVDLHARTTQRKNDHVVYVKDSGQILDILAIMGAHSQYFSYEDVRLTKEMRNEANRRANCDQANIDKAVAAAEKQIRAIRKVGIENMNDKLAQVARVRLENPDVSLTELGEMLDPPLKKAGVNGRMNKIIKMAEEADRQSSHELSL